MEKASSHVDTAHQEVIGSSYDGIPQGRVDTAHWWRYKNLRALNLWIFVPLLSIFSQGLVFSLFPSPLHLRAGERRPARQVRGVRKRRDSIFANVVAALFSIQIRRFDDERLAVCLALAELLR